MGGYGALIVFGGVWLGTTAVMICLATAWKRWKSRSQRTMVVSGRGSTNASTERSNQAVPDVMFWTMVAAPYVVYRFKSWYRGRGSPDRKLKDEYPVTVYLASRREENQYMELSGSGRGSTARTVWEGSASTTDTKDGQH
jgi:hypothetical protein